MFFPDQITTIQSLYVYAIILLNVLYSDEYKLIPLPLLYDCKLFIVLFVDVDKKKPHAFTPIAL